MKKLLLATAFAGGVFAAPAQAGQIADLAYQQPETSMAMLTARVTDNLPNCMETLLKSGTYMPHIKAEVLGRPVPQSRAREVAEELKDETPVLSIWSSPAPLMLDEFYDKIAKRLLQKTADLVNPNGREIFGKPEPLIYPTDTMRARVLFSCFPDLQPVMKGFAQRLDVAIAAKKQEQQEAQKSAVERRNARIAALTDAGYKRLTVRDFVLDGRELATSNAKVALEGVYVRDGNLDVFYASNNDLMMAQRNPNQTKVLLLTENASRDFRQKILDCRNDFGTQRFGCGIAVVGYATTCSVSFAGRVTRDEPCVAVKESW